MSEPGSDVDFAAPQPGVAAGGADHPVPVQLFDMVVVHDADLEQASGGQPLDDVEADAADADDEDAEPGDVAVGVLSPRGDGAGLGALVE